MIIEIINSINKFFGYLDISLKYLNRGYTLISIAPTLYILRVVIGLYEQGNYIQFFLYSLMFLFLVYFIVLNVLFYFFDKNIKWDVTQLLVKYLPDEAFNIAEEEDFLTSINGEYIEFEKNEHYERHLNKYMRDILRNKLIKTNDIETDNDYLIPKHTLYPFYTVEHLDGENIIKIGSSFNNLEPIGKIKSDEITPLGLFITGGEVKANGVLLREPYILKLVVKKIEIEPTENEKNQPNTIKNKDIVIVKEIK